MLTVRFVAHPVTACSVTDDGKYLSEEVAVMEHVITPKTETFSSLDDVKAAFEAFVREVEAEDMPALIMASADEKFGERKFFGFDAWVRGHRRIKYDLLKNTD